jgi:hypothetical protein
MIQIRATTTVHREWRPATRGRPIGWLGLSLAARSRAPSALAARSPRAVRACDGAVECSSTAWWWLAGGKVLPVSSWGTQGGRWARRGLVGLSPEQRYGVEAMEKSRDSSVRRQGGSSGGRWRWRRDLAVSVRKREGEGGINWGPRWRMGSLTVKWTGTG